MKDRPISEKKQKLIDDKKNSPLEVGETIFVFEKAVSAYKEKSKKSTQCIIASLENGRIMVYLQSEKHKPTATLYEIT